jgi:hypothetical protein
LPSRSQPAILAATPASSAEGYYAARLESHSRRCHTDRHCRWLAADRAPGQRARRATPGLKRGRRSRQGGQQALGLEPPWLPRQYGGLSPAALGTVGALQASAGRRRATRAVAEVIPLTVPEVRRLLSGVVWRRYPSAEHMVAWSLWRPHHQAGAKRCHFKRHGVPWSNCRCRSK